MKLLCLIFFSITAFAQGRVVNPYQFAVAGGGGGGSPAFVSMLTSGIETGSGATTTTAALGTAVSQNDRLVVFQIWNSATQTATAPSDPQSNTYSKMGELLAAGGGADNFTMWSANAGTALSSSDTITLNWGNPGNTYRAWAVFRISGCNTTTQPDLFITADHFNTSVTAPGTTLTANTVCLGVVFVNDDNPTKQYSGSAWTSAGARQDWAGADKQNYYLYKNLTATGSQDPAGSINIAANYSAIWAAFK